MTTSTNDSLAYEISSVKTRMSTLGSFYVKRIYCRHWISSSTNLDVDIKGRHMGQDQRRGVRRHCRGLIWLVCACRTGGVPDINIDFLQKLSIPVSFFHFLQINTEKCNSRQQQCNCKKDRPKWFALISNFDACQQLKMYRLIKSTQEVSEKIKYYKQQCVFLLCLLSTLHTLLKRKCIIQFINTME